MTDNTVDAIPRLPPVNPIFEGPVLSILIRFALPNMASMTAATLVVIAETSYIGRLGLEPLAAIALVFPFIVLMGMMSAGAMGGGVSSAVSRALGAGDVERASTLAGHALVIGLCGGLLFTVVLLTLGPTFFSLLGGEGRVLEEAVAYSTVLFSGAVGVWLTNTFASILRGTGNMKLPSATLLATAALQIAIGGTLGLGLFGVPQFGMRGVASGQLIAYAAATLFLAFWLFSGRSRLQLNLRTFRLRARHVLRHPEGRRHRLPVAAAVGGDRADLHPAAVALRHGDACRLRHRRTARVHAGADRRLDRHGLGADRRHERRRRQHRTRPQGRLDRRPARRRRSSARSASCWRSRRTFGRRTSRPIRACWNRRGSISTWPGRRSASSALR